MKLYIKSNNDFEMIPGTSCEIYKTADEWRLINYAVDPEKYITFSTREDAVAYAKKVSGIDEPNNIELGDTISINLRNLGDATATAVKLVGNNVLFVFDGTIGNSVINNVDSFLEDMLDRFPEDILAEISELRLLTASEVFSDCDVPSSWSTIESWGVKKDEPQIPYFKSRKARQVQFELHPMDLSERWVLNSMTDQGGYVVVNSQGSPMEYYPTASVGVRPAFLLPITTQII